MPNEMFERVREYIYEAWLDAEVQGLNAFDGMARAAIEALAEPTDAMLEASIGEGSHYHQERKQTAREIWADMINAALSGGGRGCAT